MVVAQDADASGVALMFVSNRGIQLAFSSNFDIPNSSPVLTVELSNKWYELYLIYPDGKIESVFFPTSEKDTSFVDHVPNPRVVQEYARKKGYWIDDLALELIVGRWFTEVRDWEELERLAK